MTFTSTIDPRTRTWKNGAAVDHPLVYLILSCSWGAPSCHCPSVVGEVAGHKTEICGFIVESLRGKLTAYTSYRADDTLVHSIDLCCSTQVPSTPFYLAVNDRYQDHFV